MMHSLSMHQNILLHATRAIKTYRSGTTRAEKGHESLLIYQRWTSY